MTYYFTDESIAERAVDRADAVEATFQALCEMDPRFVESIQTTTKTTSATHRRLSLWGKKLSEALEMDIDLPALQENRIVL